MGPSTRQACISSELGYEFGTKLLVIGSIAKYHWSQSPDANPGALPGWFNDMSF